MINTEVILVYIDEENKYDVLGEPTFNMGCVYICQEYLIEWVIESEQLISNKGGHWKFILMVNIPYIA